MARKRINWKVFTRRTDYPKLTWLQLELDKAKIEWRIKGKSAHAPIMEIDEDREDDAWKILDPVDDVPDDDPRYQEYDDEGRWSSEGGLQLAHQALNEIVAAGNPPKEAKDYRDFYQGKEEVKFQGSYIDAHVFEFESDDQVSDFLDKVGGAPHPQGGFRTILTASEKKVVAGTRTAVTFSEIPERSIEMGWTGVERAWEAGLDVPFEESDEQFAGEKLELVVYGQNTEKDWFVNVMMTDGSYFEADVKSEGVAKRMAEEVADLDTATVHKLERLGLELR